MSLKIYQITVDGKTITAIDTSGVTRKQFVKRQYARFGRERVGKIKNFKLKIIK